MNPTRICRWKHAHMNNDSMEVTRVKIEAQEVISGDHHNNVLIFLRKDITFILILNLHFWNYYVPLRAYAREPPFNHFNSTFYRIPAQPSKLPFLQEWQQNKGKVTGPISALRYPTRPPPRHRSPNHLTIITCQGKCRAIRRRRAPLEDVPIDLVSIDLVSIDLVSIDLVSIGVIIFVPPPPIYSVKGGGRLFRRSCLSL